VENSTKRAPWRCERLEEVVLVADVARDALLTKKRPRAIIALARALVVMARSSADVRSSGEAAVVVLRRSRA